MDTAGFGVGLALLWSLTSTATAAAIALAVITTVMPSRWLTGSAAAALVLAVALAATPHPRPAYLVGVLFALAALALSAIGGSPVVRTVLDLATRGREVEGPAGGIMVGAAPGRRELLRGGLTIGVLERLAVTAAILVGAPQAIAVVVAIKGVGRFTELVEPEARERFIIGTFVSLGWAAVCGALVHFV